MPHNVNLEERFRITISMNVKGNWTFTIIGVHTLFEVMGLLTAIVQMIGRKALDQKNPDLVQELMKGGHA